MINLDGELIRRLMAPEALAEFTRQRGEEEVRIFSDAAALLFNIARDQLAERIPMPPCGHEPCWNFLVVDTILVSAVILGSMLPAQHMYSLSDTEAKQQVEAVRALFQKPDCWLPIETVLRAGTASVDIVI
jgi:hypothetical protein